MGKREDLPLNPRSILMLRAIFAGLISQKELARALGLTERTLIGWATQGRGPEIVKLGGKVYYFRDEAEKLCASMGKKPPSSAIEPELRVNEATIPLDYHGYRNWFTRAELAKALGVTERTLVEWVNNSEGPRCVSTTSQTKYYPEDVLNWFITRVMRNRGQNHESYRKLLDLVSETVGDPPPIL